MRILDAQLHPPAPISLRPGEVGDEHALTVELSLMSMDAAGVDASVLAPTVSELSQLDFPLLAIERHPDRFASVMLVSSGLEDMAQEVGRALDRPGIVGIRVVEPGMDQRLATVIRQHDRTWTPDGPQRLRAGAWDPAFDECVRRGLPAQLFFSTCLEDAEPFVRAHPDLQVVLIHMGLFRSNPGSRFTEGDPFQQLPLLLRLAQHENVVVQLSHGNGLSQQDYPFSDLWPAMHQIFEAYGPERLMWGSDWTFNRAIFSCAEWIHFFRDTTEISEADKEQIFSGTLRRVYRWPDQP
jgi:predicted TIM-barrel fold metal-dependent hydrolase